MQLSAQILQADWHVLLGWASIAAGLAVAAQALGLGRSRGATTHILRAYRPAEWSAHQSGRERVRPMDPARQVQRLVAIAESRVAQVGVVADLHARAAAEVEAVDDALVGLLADFTPDAIRSVRQRETADAPAPIAEPLAA